MNLLRRSLGSAPGQAETSQRPEIPQREDAMIQAAKSF
jgi:hypothetical protein